jgi:hypothetical protein
MVDAGEIFVDGGLSTVVAVGTIDEEYIIKGSIGGEVIVTVEATEVVLGVKGQFGERVEDEVGSFEWVLDELLGHYDQGGFGKDAGSSGDIDVGN